MSMCLISMCVINFEHYLLVTFSLFSCFISPQNPWFRVHVSSFLLVCLVDLINVSFKASAHSFKQFTSRLLKLSFSLSMHIYNSDGRHAWFHLHGTSRPDRSASKATKYKMKNSLSTVGLEPSTLRFQVWCSTYWASRAWWMLSV